MKTIKLLQTAILSAILAFTSCVKDDFQKSVPEKEVRVTLSTELSSPASLTRAGEALPDIAGYHIRYILEVWTTGSTPQLYHRQVISATSEQKGVFDLQFVSGREYDILLWADYVKDEKDAENNDLNIDLHYLTASLKAVTKNTSAECGGLFDKDAYNTRDAFYAGKKITVNGDVQESIILNRAVAQLNIFLTDYEKVDASLQPDNASIVIEAPGMMDISSGLVSSTKVSYSAGTSLDATTPGKAKAFTGYYFAPKGNAELINFTVAFNKGSDAITTYDIANIPVQRNYRTNVSGNMLTKTGKISVEINPEYLEPDYEQEVTTVNTAAEMQTKLNEGVKNISVTEPLAADLTILIPSNYTAADEKVSITMPNDGNHNVTVEYNPALTGGQSPRRLNLNVTKVNNLVINTPGTSVVLDGVEYNTIETTTATAETVTEHTFTLGRAATVNSFTAKQGDVILYGIVSSELIRDAGFKGNIIRGIASSEDMIRAAMDNVSGYDYMLVEYEFTTASARTGRTIDGGGAVFSQPMVVSRSVEMQNFTINNSTTKPAFKIANSNIDVTLSNVTINQSANGRGVEINDAYSNISFTIRNSNIIIPNSKQYGVMVINASDIWVTIDGTHIAPQKDRMSNELTDYTAEQITAFKTRTDARSVAVANSKNIHINVLNSVLEGSMYALYTQNSDFVTINISGSTLDGRAALEIGNTYKEATTDNKSIYNITNSKLIGRNYFGGPTEDFATIVFYNTDSRISENNYVYLKNSEIYCFNNPQTPTNWQYAADMRPDKYNLLSFDNVKIMDHSKRLDYVVKIQSDKNEFKSVDATVHGKDGVRLLQ